MTDLGDLRALFLRAYSNVPDSSRDEIIVVTDEKSYTWNTAYFEIKQDSDLGNKILKTLNVLKII